jgi:Cu/Ag efflux protein CusF
MFCRIYRSIVLSSSLAVAVLALTPQLAAASQGEDRGARAEHAVAGEVKKVDRDAKTIVIHTADGIDDTVKFTERHR